LNSVIELVNLQANKSGLVVLEGELTFDTVPEIYRQTRQLLAQGDRLKSIELSALKRVDSAGLALLLEWQSVAHQQGRTLRFDNAPDELVRLAALCDADELLGFEHPQESNNA
jgi:phospholipid transport system transporter-binding protein